MGKIKKIKKFSKVPHRIYIYIYIYIYTYIYTYKPGCSFGPQKIIYEQGPLWENKENQKVFQSATQNIHLYIYIYIDIHTYIDLYKR